MSRRFPRWVAVPFAVLCAVSGCGGTETGSAPPEFDATPATRALAVEGKACGPAAWGGRRLAIDASGIVYVAAICGGEGYVAVSRDGAKTFAPPVAVALSDLVLLVVKGGPGGVAYLVGTTNEPAGSDSYFARTVDGGTTWEAPVLLAAEAYALARGASIAARGDDVFVHEAPSLVSTVYRNTSRGAGAFETTALPAGPVPAFSGLVIDSAGTLWNGVDNGPLRLSTSSDGGVTFGPWASVPDAAVLGGGHWAIGADVIWVAGSYPGPFRISVDAPGEAVEVAGLVDPTSGERALAVDDAGTAYVATGGALDGVRLQRATLADAAFRAATPVDALGRNPSLASPPGAGKVVVAYERSGEVWTAVRVH